MFEGAAGVLYVVEKFKCFETEMVIFWVGVSVKGLHSSEVVLTSGGVIEGCELGLFTFLNMGFDQNRCVSAFLKSVLWRGGLVMYAAVTAATAAAVNIGLRSQ